MKLPSTPLFTRWLRNSTTRPSSTAAGAVLSIEDLCSEFRGKLNLHAEVECPEADSDASECRPPPQQRPIAAPHSALTQSRSCAYRRAASSQKALPVLFGSPTPLKLNRRHRPYDLSSRPQWSVSTNQKAPAPKPLLRPSLKRRRDLDDSWIDGSVANNTAILSADAPSSSYTTQISGPSTWTSNAFLLHTTRYLMGASNQCMLTMPHLHSIP